MHKIYENDDLMMYFQKRYCHCCGSVLSRKRIERVVRKDDPEHRSYCMIGTSYKPYGDIMVIGKEYYCASCNRSFSCETQGEVIEAQKHYARKVVSIEEIKQVQNNQIVESVRKLQRLKWLLLLPVIGTLICTFYIFNGRLSQWTDKKDGAKLWGASILVFLGVALIVKIVLSLFGGVELIRTYQSTIMLIPALLSVNVPTLWYINHAFR